MYSAFCSQKQDTDKTGKMIGRLLRQKCKTSFATGWQLVRQTVSRKQAKTESGYRLGENQVGRKGKGVEGYVVGRSGIDEGQVSRYSMYMDPVIGGQAALPPASQPILPYL